MAEIAAGVVANLCVLAAVGLGVGLIAGFAGVSGGYLLTPIVIVLGFPATYAVGTGLALMTANTLVAVLRHKDLGHLDLKMGPIMAAGTVVGAEAGVRLLQRSQQIGESFANVGVLAAMIGALAIVALSMVREVWRSSERLTAVTAGDAAAAEDFEVQTAACRFLQGLCIFPHISLTKSKLRISGWVVLLVGAGIGVL